MKGIPCEDLKPILRDLLIEKFGAQPKPETPYQPQVETQATVPAVVDINSLNNESATSAPEKLNGHTAAPAPVVSAPAVIAFTQSGKEVTCTEEDFILDVAEQAGIELPSSCRSGTCGTCKQKLLEGKVEYEGEPEALDDREIAENVILTCISHPVGKVVIDA